MDALRDGSEVWARDGPLGDPMHALREVDEVLAHDGPQDDPLDWDKWLAQDGQMDVLQQVDNCLAFP